MVLGSPPFPISPAELTTDFLSHAVGAEVSAFVATRIGEDRGMLGVILLLDITCAEPDHVPKRLVAKFAALRDGSLDSAKRSLSHERELRFYDELLPQTPVAAPRPLAAWYDPDTARFLLLQEAIDTDPSIDQLGGLDMHQARLVLSEAAKLHATWWASSDLEHLRWLPRLDSDQRRHNLTTLAQSGWGPLCAMLGDELSAEEVALGRAFPQRLDEALVAIAQHPSTLIHSDLRTDNLLFSPSGDKVTLVDWQGAGTGPPAFDLAYFLSQCLTTEVRRTHEDDLLDYYRSELALAGVSLSTEQVRAGYAESMLFGLTIACALPLIGDPKVPRVKALAATVARRSLEALRDHDQLWEPAP